MQSDVVKPKKKLLPFCFQIARPPVHGAHHVSYPIMMLHCPTADRFVLLYYHYGHSKRESLLVHSECWFESPQDYDHVGLCPIPCLSSKDCDTGI